MTGVAEVAAPDAAAAMAMAHAATGEIPLAARRFTTGSAHYVFEVSFRNREPVVVRANTASGREAMAGAAALSRLLRPLGVPLPAIFAQDLKGPFAYLVMERLPGSDLGDVVGGLASAALIAIARRVAAAQRIVAQTPSAGRYGYAVEPRSAPYEGWSGVVEAHLQRSRQRIISAGLFTTQAVEAVSEQVAARKVLLDAQPATPFLHDTTTKNVIVTADGRFSGIVDVDDLCFGDPRYVVALTRVALWHPGCPPLTRTPGWTKRVSTTTRCSACTCCCFSSISCPSTGSVSTATNGSRSRRTGNIS
jgi:aminoglycoside phosphotransferase (APT) family kinase protein